MIDLDKQADQGLQVHGLGGQVDQSFQAEQECCRLQVGSRCRIRIRNCLCPGTRVSLKPNSHPREKMAKTLLTQNSRLEAAGKIDIGKNFNADMALSLGIGKEQVISVNISEVNILELVRLAARMADIKAMESLNGGEDILVFRDVKLYFSTGAKVFDVYYERGIHVKGSMEFLKKTGNFDGSFTDDGVMIKAGVDNFNIGGLEVTSAKAGGKRAALEVELTKEAQRFLINGMIQYHDFHLKIDIDADVQERRLDADVCIQFLQELSFQLKAQVRIPESKRLDGLVVTFEAELHPDVFGVIYDGINNSIEAIGKLATKTIDDAISDLQDQINQHQGDLAAMKKDLEQMKIESDAEVQRRQNEINKKNDELNRLRTELDAYEQDVKDAQDRKEGNDEDVREKKAKKEEAQRKLDNKVREMRSEYDRKVSEQKQKQAECERKKKELEDQKQDSWGNFLRDKQLADGVEASLKSKFFSTTIGFLIWCANVIILQSMCKTHMPPRNISGTNT